MVLSVHECIDGGNSFSLFNANDFQISEIILKHDLVLAILYVNKFKNLKQLSISLQRSVVTKACSEILKLIDPHYHFAVNIFSCWKSKYSRNKIELKVHQRKRETRQLKWNFCNEKAFAMSAFSLVQIATDFKSFIKT